MSLSNTMKAMDKYNRKKVRFNQVRVESQIPEEIPEEIPVDELECISKLKNLLNEIKEENYVLKESLTNEIDVSHKFELDLYKTKKKSTLDMKEEIERIKNQFGSAGVAFQSSQRTLKPIKPSKPPPAKVINAKLAKI